LARLARDENNTSAPVDVGFAVEIVGSRDVFAASST
jgi:hypothetical protein